MKYEDIRNSLKTGDIVLFSGKGNISTGIKYATRSRWSHVGMVLVLPEYDFTCLWESTTLSDIRDVSGVLRRGVQLVPLSDRIQQYRGEIAFRKLLVNVPDDSILKLMILRKELRDRPYEKNKLELIRAAYDGPFGANAEDLSSLFCSELVAEAYQALGLIDEREPSNEYTPADFADRRTTLPLGVAIDLD